MGGLCPSVPSVPEIEVDMEAVGEAITDACKGIPENIAKNKREFPGKTNCYGDWTAPDTTVTLNKDSTQDDIDMAAIESACGIAVKDAIKDSIWGQFEPKIDEQLDSVEPALPRQIINKAKDKFKEITIDPLVDAAVDKCLDEAKKGVNASTNQHKKSYFEPEKKQQHIPLILNDEKNADLYLDKAINNISKAAEILKQSKKYQNVTVTTNKIKTLEESIAIVNNIWKVDGVEYANWGLQEIMLYICQIENGKYTKYADKLHKGFTTMNIVSGAELPEISSFLLRKFGIENGDDRNDLIKYFQALKMDQNINISSIDNYNHNKNGIDIEGGAKTAQKDIYL